MAENYPEREPYREEHREERRPDERAPERERQWEEFPEKPGPSVIKANRVINYVFRILESLILIRLLLKALGGNIANAFVNFIYTITGPFVAPFLSVFNIPVISTSIGVIELGSIVAIAFYVLLNYAIVKLIWILSAGE